MFTEIIVKNQDGTEATDSRTGLKCKRRCMYFVPNGDEESIKVYYKQWLVGLDGYEVEPCQKNYYINNVPAVYYQEGEILTLPTYYQEGELISPETYYTEGEIMNNGEVAVGGEVRNPAVYGTGVEIKTPAIYSDGTDVKVANIPNFDNWKNFAITNNHVGLTLEQLFVTYQINPRLQLLPINVENEYNNN